MGAVFLLINKGVSEGLQSEEALTRSFHVGNLFGCVDAEDHRVLFTNEHLILRGMVSPLSIGYGA